MWLPHDTPCWIRDRDDCATIILGSGDADYQVLVDRARVHGRRIVLCAFSQSVSRDMLATAPLFPLEAKLGIRLAEHRDVDVEIAPVSEVDDNDVDDLLVKFVREMHQLEGRMNFVGYGMLCNQWMLDWGIAWNEYECRRLVDEYLEEGMVERHEVVNPNNPDWPTAAVKLVRNNERVRSAGVQRGARVKPRTGARITPRAEACPSCDGPGRWDDGRLGWRSSRNTPYANQRPSQLPLPQGLRKPYLSISARSD